VQIGGSSEEDVRQLKLTPGAVSTVYSPKMSTASVTTTRPVSTIVSEGVWLSGKLDIGAFVSLEDAYGCAPSGRICPSLSPSSNPSPRVPKCKLPLKAPLAPRLETITTVSTPYWRVLVDVVAKKAWRRPPSVTPHPNLDECIGHGFDLSKIVSLQCNTKGVHSALGFH